MLRGLPASIVFHVGIIFAGSIAWPYLASSETEFIVVPIEIVEYAPDTNITAQVRRDDPVEEEIPEEPPKLEDYLENVDALPDEEELLPDEEQLAADDIAPPPPETKEPEPLPDLDKPDEEDERAEEPEPEPEPKEPEPEPEIVREEQTDDFDEFLMAATNVLDKAEPRQRQAPPPEPEPEVLRNEQPAVETPRKAAGDRTSNTSSVIGLIQQQMKVCWDDVVDLPNPERLNVTVRMSLNRDGSLDGTVQLVNPARAPIGDRAMATAIDRALRAARKCAPYRLPEDAQDDYDEWKDVTLRIGPGFGG